MVTKTLQQSSTGEVTQIEFPLELYSKAIHFSFTFSTKTMSCIKYIVVINVIYAYFWGLAQLDFLKAHETQQASLQVYQAPYPLAQAV
mmetsp:Transcript_24693/g.32231  ORF Transcript_24693/g.32231 Transcript_24693/m.32231 type:complete len:88 (+) Transcript_24693:193-456(+)